MGYAGYYSTTSKIPDKLSPLDEALRMIPEMDTLEIIAKLIRNVVIQPNEDKFRRIRISNPKINSTVADVAGGMDTLLAMGWTIAEEEGEEVLVVSKGKLTMKEVRAVEDAKDRLKKELRSASVSRSSSQKSLKDAQGSSKDTEADTARAILKAQLEADRRERAAAAPITTGSKAQPLPGAGPNIGTCKDAGIQGNQGGCC